MCAAYEDGVVPEEGVNPRKVAALRRAPIRWFVIRMEVGEGDDGKDEVKYIRCSD